MVRFCYFTKKFKRGIFFKYFLSPFVTIALSRPVTFETTVFMSTEEQSFSTIFDCARCHWCILVPPPLQLTHTLSRTLNKPRFRKFGYNTRNSIIGT